MFVMKATLWKSNMNFVKDIPMMRVYANFNILVIVIVSEGKNRKLYFRTEPRIAVKQYLLLGYDIS